MFKSQKFLSGVLICISLAVAVNCQNNSEPQPLPVEEEIEPEINLVSIIARSDKTSTLVGESGNNIQFTAIGTYESNSNRSTSEITELNWTSTNTDVAQIDSKGLLTANSYGQTSVSAESVGIISNSITIDVVEFAPTAKTAFIGANVLTMNSEVILENQTVIIEDGVITALGDVIAISVPEGAKEIDATGKFLMPGLSDMHAHPFWSTDLTLYVANGVTSILDMGNGAHFTGAKAWRDQVVDGELLGPNIYVSAMARGVSDGGFSDVIVVTPDDGRAFVDNHSDFDFIKVYNAISASTFEAIVDQAALYDISVIGHGVRELGMLGILNGGQKMIAHAEEFLYTFFQGNNSDAKITEGINAILDAGAYVTGTLSTFEAVVLVWGSNQAGYDQLKSRPGYQYTNRQDKPDWDRQFNSVYNQAGSQEGNFNLQKNFMKKFHDSGVPIMLGTDSPIIIGMAGGFSIHDDMRIYSEIGISNYDILKMGTVNPAAFINTYSKHNDPYGKIQEGYRADLILLDNSPLANLQNLRKPMGVMVRGVWYPGAYLQFELDKLKN